MGINKITINKFTLEEFSEFSRGMTILVDGKERLVRDLIAERGMFKQGKAYVEMIQDLLSEHTTKYPRRR